jgi:hypothetical protein
MIRRTDRMNFKVPTGDKEKEMVIFLATNATIFP